jgi:hypothetical protein
MQERALRQAQYLHAAAPKLTEVFEKAGFTEYSLLLRRTWETLAPLGEMKVCWYNMEEERAMSEEVVEN